MLTAPLMRPAEVFVPTAERILPPRRTRPSDAAARYLKDDKGDWDPATAPMIAEPLDVLSGREYQGIAFAGPQRSSKTFGLILGGLSYIVTCAPGDTLIVQMTQDTARDFSRGDLDKVIRHSPEINARLSRRPRDDNTYDKWFRSGMRLKLGWPAISQLRGKTLRYAFITEYDSPENRDDVDGYGPLWDLTFKRIQTYMSRGKCLAESAPGEDFLDLKWKPRTPHEAPPCRGILSIYNNGTRGRWYWPCFHCNEFFEAKPGFDLFRLPGLDKLREIVAREDIETLVGEFARVVCPHCDGIHEQHMKGDMNAAGMWLHDGQQIKKGKRVGDPRRTNIWSGWLGGVAASYQRWDGIVRNYLQAVQTYVRTADESPMRLVSTSDVAMPYTPQVIRSRRSVEALVKRTEDWPKGYVPQGVRFLTAAADTQGNRFVVQVHGWGVAREHWLIDRYDITASRRREGGGNAGLQPGVYLEDWMVLVDALQRKYRFAGHEDVELPIHVMLVDSHGSEGVTQNSYQFWRHIKGQGLGARLQLLRGTGRPSAPRIKETWPDTSKRKDRRAGSKGDVPVWQIGTIMIKDAVAGDLARSEPGPGYLHLPDWLYREKPDVFDELVSEVRTEKGWDNPGRRPNEGFDLVGYNLAAFIAVGGERIDWDNPPIWAADPVAQAKFRGKTGPRRRRVRNQGIRA